jgi:6,7-dimethyl-8-ribityllumazine synthase
MMNFTQMINAESIAKVTFSVVLVVSTFNEPITKALKEGALQRLAELGFQNRDVLVVEVPGAVEIPITAQRLAKTGQFEVIIALGAVIRGETSHYDYVCDLVSTGCQKVALEHDIPVIFGVLTTEDEAQAWDRLGGNHGHNGIKAVDAAVQMQKILAQINASSINTLRSS